jgi:hypothetical protein
VRATFPPWIAPWHHGLFQSNKKERQRRTSASTFQCFVVFVVGVTPGSVSVCRRIGRSSRIGRSKCPQRPSRIPRSAKLSLGSQNAAQASSMSTPNKGASSLIRFAVSASNDHQAFTQAQGDTYGTLSALGMLSETWGRQPTPVSVWAVVAPC